LKTDLVAAAMVGGSRFAGQTRESFARQVGKREIRLQRPSDHSSLSSNCHSEIGLMSASGVSSTDGGASFSGSIRSAHSRA
jgi:hypothetical protein